MVTPCAPGYTLVTPVFGEGVTAQASGTPREFSMVTPVTPELRTYKGDSRGESGAYGASARTRPPSREIGCNGCNGVTGDEPSGASGWLAWTARAALPTHDPASVPSAASPEPPGCLCAPPAAVPWLAPSTSIRAPGESGQGTVRARLRLPTVAECAELLAGGWTPVLGRLGVWVDDSGDSRDGGGRGLLRSRDGTGAGLAPMAGEARATVHLGVPFWQRWQRERQNGNDR